jgi:5-methylcytosine-specific restriction endonuclease McrA/endogenous inhibitor of DNA gyrase (YacG/DUF329 family)
MPVTVICEHCGVEKKIPPSYASRPGKRFCSQKCAGAATANKVEVPCAQCGKGIMKRPNMANSDRFCSTGCFAEHRSAKPSTWGVNSDPEVRRLYFRNYIEKNREYINSSSQAWAKNNRSKRNELQQNRRSAGYVTKKEREELMSLFDRKCAHCGSLERLEIDHITPVSCGGLTVRENLQVLCRSCNASKGKGEKSKMPKPTNHNIQIKET